MGTITRRLESVFNSLSDEFGTIYTKYDVECKLRQLNSSRGNSSDYYSKLTLFMDFLDSIHVDYDENREDYDYFHNLVSDMSFPDFEELESDMLYKLYKIFEKYPVPQEYMLRIVNRLSDKEDNWQDDPLRLRILKQFIKYGNYLSDAGAGGKGQIKKYVKAKLGGKISSKDELQVILDNIDDGIFDLLENANKDQREFSGTYGLMKVCDDLASGQFRMGGSTKKNLYLFAIVYNMTFYIPDNTKGQIIDYESDIEKNLFHDYYVNNLMRFLTAPYKGNRSSFEKEPSGLGINYKNFAEMIYLYYISKSEEECSRPEKIRLATEMIARVKENGFEKTNNHLDTVTVFLKESFCEDILVLDDAKFEKYLMDNYDCNIYIDYGGTGTKLSEMQVSVNQNSAFGVFNKIIDDIKLELDLEDLADGLWFADMENGYEFYSKKHSDIDKEKFDEFMALMDEINRSSNLMVRVEDIKEAKDMTRTALIVALYHKYNLQKESDEEARYQSFAEVFEEFSVVCNKELEEASYQPFTCKNIFDMFIAFSIYAYQTL